MTKNEIDDIRTQFTRKADAYPPASQARDEATPTMSFF
jgi:hypothetical protein